MRKIFDSKKAEFSVLLVLIAAVIVGIILLAVGYKIVIGSSKLSQEQKCHLSIFAADQAAALKKATGDVFDMVPNLECVPDRIIIEPKDVKRSKRGRIDDDLVKGLITAEHYKCAETVGFPDMNPFTGAWPQKDKTFCMTCATIKFSDEFIEEAKKEDYHLKALRYWMATRTIQGKGMSLYKYIYGKDPSSEEIAELKNNPEEWPLGIEYFIIWRFERQDRKLTGVLIMAAGFALGGFPGYFIGFGVARQFAGVTMMQSINLFPKTWLSEKILFEGSDEEKDICTVLIN